MKKKKPSKLKQFFTRRKLAITFLIMFVSVILFNFRDVIFCPYPAIVMDYRYRYNQMATPEYLERLRAFTNGSLIIVGTTSNGVELELSLNGSIDGLDYSRLLEWEHKHLMYWGGELQVRPETPIEILTTNILLTEESFIALGRCGEFALLYNGLLLANNYTVRLVVDCSLLTNISKSSAGDHVWVEMWLNDSWIHCDPTEGYFNDPTMYADPNRWNKDINLIYAIEGSIITDVTKTYQLP